MTLDAQTWETVFLGLFVVATLAFMALTLRALREIAGHLEDIERRMGDREGDDADTWWRGE